MSSPGIKPKPARHRWITRAVVLASGLGLTFLFQAYLTDALGLPPQKPPAPDRSPALEMLKADAEPLPPRLPSTAPSGDRNLLAQASLTAIPLHSRDIMKAWDETLWPPPTTYIPSVPKGLEAAVRFWELIYASYDSNQVVFHDSRDLAVIYSVLDFNEAMASPSLTSVAKERFRNQAVQEESARILAILSRLAEDPAVSLTDPRDRAIRNRLGSRLDPETMRRLADPERIRSQTGLKDRFARALATSGRYLKEFENIFDSYGLPWPLTRMVFVESMFRLDAISRSGAVGLWQFMRGTAKRYMTVNKYIDERYDPFISTHAAARLFTENYRHLKSWPLTINAYNVGRGRMEHAVAQLGTADITAIIREYSHPSYAFASRNFYPEFLAAFRIEQNARKYFGDIEIATPLEYDVVNLPRGVRLADITAMTHVPTEALFSLNPALARSWWGDSRPLPAHSRVRVPRGTALKIEATFATR